MPTLLSYSVSGSVIYSLCLSQRHDKGYLNVMSFFLRHGGKKCSRSLQNVLLFFHFHCHVLKFLFFASRKLSTLPFELVKNGAFFLRSFDFNYNSIAVACIQRNVHFFIALNNKSFHHSILFTSLFNLCSSKFIYANALKAVQFDFASLCIHNMHVNL